MIGLLEPAEAAELHAAFLGDLVERLRLGRFDLELAWSLDPDEPLPTAAHPGIRQRGGDLGERLFAGLNEVAVRYPFVAAVGSDHPDLPSALVEEAFSRLEEGADVALGPAVDGGYYLIAVRREALDRRMFDEIEWSTDSVLAATLERCRELKLQVARLATAADVDRPEDLRRLARRLIGGGGAGETVECPRTARLLRAWNWHEEEA